MGAPHLRACSRGHIPRFPHPQTLWHHHLLLVVGDEPAVARRIVPGANLRHLSAGLLRPR